MTTQQGNAAGIEIQERVSQALQLVSPEITARHALQHETAVKTIKAGLDQFNGVCALVDGVKSAFESVSGIFTSDPKITPSMKSVDGERTKQHQALVDALPGVITGEMGVFGSLTKDFDASSDQTEKLLITNAMIALRNNGIDPELASEKEARQIGAVKAEHQRAQEILEEKRSLSRQYIGVIPKSIEEIEARQAVLLDIEEAKKSVEITSGALSTVRSEPDTSNDFKIVQEQFGKMLAIPEPVLIGSASERCVAFGERASLAGSEVAGKAVQAIKGVLGDLAQIDESHPRYQEAEELTARLKVVRRSLLVQTKAVDGAEPVVVAAPAPKDPEPSQPAQRVKEPYNVVNTAQDQSQSNIDAIAGEFSKLPTTIANDFDATHRLDLLNQSKAGMIKAGMVVVSDKDNQPALGALYTTVELSPDRKLLLVTSIGATESGLYIDHTARDHQEYLLQALTATMKVEGATEIWVVCPPVGSSPPLVERLRETAGQMGVASEVHSGWMEPFRDGKDEVNPLANNHVLLQICPETPINLDIKGLTPSEADLLLQKMVGQMFPNPDAALLVEGELKKALEKK